MRSCAGCTECCKTLEVLSLMKPAGQDCSHCLLGKGCKIYETRPQECKDYRCLWLQGHGPEELKPSESGAMFSAFGPRQIRVDIRSGIDWKKNRLIGEAISRLLEGGWAHILVVQDGQPVLFPCPFLPLPSNLEKAIRTGKPETPYSPAWPESPWEVWREASEVPEYPDAKKSETP